MSSTKKLICTGTLRQVLPEFIDWRNSQSCWYFRPSFVNWCPSPLLFGLTLPPPLPCVNKYTVYTYTVCTGYGVLNLRQINACRRVPLQVIILDDDTFCIAFYESHLSMVFVMQASECRQCEFTPCMCMTASPQLLSPSQAGALSKPALQVAL
jgi:hypothetical protein